MVRERPGPGQSESGPELQAQSWSLAAGAARGPGCPPGAGPVGHRDWRHAGGLSPTLRVPSPSPSPATRNRSGLRVWLRSPVSPTESRTRRQPRSESQAGAGAGSRQAADGRRGRVAHLTPSQSESVTRLLLDRLRWTPSPAMRFEYRLPLPGSVYAIRSLITIARCASFGCDITRCASFGCVQVLVVISLTIKFWLLSEALDFNYSAQDYQQSGF